MYLESLEAPVTLPSPLHGQEWAVTGVLILQIGRWSSQVDPFQSHSWRWQWLEPSWPTGFPVMPQGVQDMPSRNWGLWRANWSLERKMVSVHDWCEASALGIFDFITLSPLTVGIISYLLQIRQSRLELSNLPPVTRLGRDGLGTLIQVCGPLFCPGSFRNLTLGHTAVASVSCFVQERDGVDFFFFYSGSIYTELNYFGMSLTEAGVLTWNLYFMEVSVYSKSKCRKFREVYWEKQFWSLFGF